MTEFEIQRGAFVDGPYRYWLKRRWDGSPPEAEATGPQATFVMLNPSTADRRKDDRTILRCMTFAQRHGFGGLLVVNLYAYVTPRPSELWRARADGVDVVGPRNDKLLAELGERTRTGSDVLVAAWGAGAPADRVLEVLELTGWDAFKALGVTKDGHPKHPLARGRHRIPDDAQLMPWPPAVIP